MSKKSKEKKPFANKKKKNLIEGIVRINQRGFGFLQVIGPTKISYLIAHHEMPALMDGDRISCELEQVGQKSFAKPVQVLQRGHRSLFGRVIQTDSRVYFEAQGNFSRPRFLVNAFEDKKWSLQPSDTVFRAEILSYPSHERGGSVKLLQAVGLAGTLATEIALLVGAVDVGAGFPAEVLEQAASFGENPDEEEIEKRKDLTPLSFCTIDGETAKDFDDAVFAQTMKTGIRVKVAIADVSHYVTPGSPIDEEAYRRGTSLYYAGSCEPMIPEHLSNGLCSLKSNVPRLVMVADFMVDEAGGISGERFYRAVIKSKARLTYKQVQAHRDGQSVELIKNDKHLEASLSGVYEASKRIRAAREARGAIDFDSVESHIALNDNGEPISIHPEQRLMSHKIIEDLMIAANEAVATYIESKKAPCVYRIHEAPDATKFENFVKLAQMLGVLTPQDVPARADLKDPKILSAILSKVRLHPARDALETLFLRSMMQARYSAENIGHFGLASKSYLHFTSPIRRYPDLVDHRALTPFLEGNKASRKKKDESVTADQASAMAMYLSDRERKVVDVERNITALFACWYMKDKVGEEDDGIIVSCTDFGAFVRLSSFHVDGLLHIGSLGIDQYEFVPEEMRIVGDRSKVSYGIGDKIRVKVMSVNIERRHIDLHLAPRKEELAEEEAPAKTPEKKKRTTKKKANG
jgi:ribonuclease R